MLEACVAALARAPLADQTRRTYASKVRQYLAWLEITETDGDPLTTADSRDWAVRDYRTHLQAVLKRRLATVNSALAAVDDLYIRRHLGPANANRVDLPDSAPRSLSQRGQLRYLRAVQAAALASRHGRGPCASTARASESVRSRSTPSWPRRGDDGHHRPAGVGDRHRRRRGRPHIPAKLAAMRCHHTQVGDMGFFLGMPVEAFTAGFGQEWYVRMRAPAGTPADHLV